ncbi:hypothetical protein COE56_20510 [Bacillus anthracis]|nr:hypothetical protein COE56_20510 [Bacillus anthracis]
MGSKTPTSKCSESKEVRWGGGMPIKARLVQLIISGGMKKTPLIKVSLHVLFRNVYKCGKIVLN